MLNVTLIELRRELRAETGSSLNPAQGVQVQATLDLILARQQRELWDAYNWQHLTTYADVRLNDGQAVYAYPSQLKFDQIARMMIATGVMRDSGGAILSSSAWYGLTYGIEPHMIPLGAPRQGVPVRWGNRVSVDTTGADVITDPVGQFELMPTPPTYPNESRNDMVVRITGQAPLSPLIADADKCIIDSTVIVLFAAAEVMANQKNEAAPMKLQKAQNYLRKLLADQGADKRDNYNMGGNQRGGVDPDQGRRAVPYIDYIP